MDPALANNATIESCAKQIVDDEVTISQNIVERYWHALLDVIGDDPDILYVWYLTFYIYALYWTVGGLFLTIDLTNRPKFMRKYKTQPGTHEPLEWEHCKRLITTVAFNQIVLGFPMSYVIYHVSKMFYSMPDVRVVPSFGILLRDITICLLVWDAALYYIHRMFHSRHFYQRFHKLHHEWRAPVALTGMYVTPFEFAISAMIPLYLGPAIMHCCLFTTTIWLTIVVWDNLGDHTGYHLPFLDISEAHDYHHLNFNQCYGNFGLLDRQRIVGLLDIKGTVVFLALNPPENLCQRNKFKSETKRSS